MSVLICKGQVILVISSSLIAGRRLSIQQIFRNLQYEAAHRIVLGLSPEHASLRTGNGQLLLRSGDGYVGKAALFFHFLLSLCLYGHKAREHTVFHAGQINLRKFQSLCTVNRHQDYAVIILPGTVCICHQSHFLQKA